MSTRPIMIAVGGDSGAGKTTFCRGLDAIFGAERIATISMDDYHSLDRGQRRAAGIDAVDPRASNFAAMGEDFRSLREGRAIDKPVYRHGDGTFGEPVRVEPRDIVVIEGLFPLFTRSLRSLFDVSVWLDPEAELKAAWKIQRDVQDRGYTRDAVLAEMRSRAPDVERYIQPQARYADLTLQVYRADPGAEAVDSAQLSARIRKGGRFQALDAREFESPSTTLRTTRRSSDGYPETVIELDGRIAPELANTVEDRIWSHIDARTGSKPERLGEFQDGAGTVRTGYALALAQLLIARRVVLVEGEFQHQGSQ